MKRTVAMIAALAAVVLMTVAAQAAGKGEQIFKEKCTMCHVVKGQGGRIGPDLTRIAAKLKEKDIRMKLENPKKSNPASAMPSFKTLPKAEMDALLGYLKTLK
ncbi:MAG TPA: c-type cytochrome [Desulfuromonadaceae bacterium]